MFDDQIDVDAAERLVAELQSKGVQVCLRDAYRVAVHPPERVAPEDAGRVDENLFGLLRALKRKVDWRSLEARAAGLVGTEPGVTIGWRMRDVYAERIGHDRQVVERWLDIMRRSRPASPEMSQLKARIVEIVTNRKWVRKAIAQGWSEREVLGICPWAPLTRPDAQGVVVAIALQPRAGMSVTRVTEDRITFRRKRSSGRLVHYRWLAGIADSVPIWEAIVTGVADDREMAN